MPLNFDLAGKVYEPVEATITAEQIAQYAAASRDPNPQHSPGPSQVASLVFPVVPGFTAMGAAAVDPELGVDNPLMIVHGEQRFRYYRPLRAGDKLVMTPSLESVEDKGRGAIFVVKVSAADIDGDPVVDAWATIFVRGGGSGGERPATEPPAVPVRLAEAARFTRHVDTDMPREYAAASGDHNPIHLDPAVAAAVGLPGVINHGLGTLSLVAGGLVSELTGGDVSAVRTLQVRFTDLVLPGSDIDTTVWSTTEVGRYDFESSRPDGGTVLSGSIGVDAT